MAKKADEAKADYLAGMSYKDIATKYGVSAATVRAWKSRYHWDTKKSKSESATKSATQHKRNATKRNTVAADLLQNADDMPWKQQLFCLYYLQRYNATWAYQKAYGAQASTARSEGPRLLTNPRIKAALAKLKKEQSNELYINANDILKEFIRQATANLGDYLKYDVQEFEDDTTEDVNGNPQKFSATNLRPKDMSEVDMSLVQEMHLGRDGLVIKLYDKQKAMQVLLDRLPEPTNENVDQDSFIQAILESTRDNRNEKEDDDK